MAWAYSAAHGYVLIPLAPEAPPRQPQPGPPGYAPPARAATPPGYPPDYQSSPAPRQGNVIPFKHQSCQLVRPGNKDVYADFLAGVPDLSPNSSFAYMASGLAPEEAEVSGLPEMAPPAPANPNTVIHENPAQDAFGPRGVVTKRFAPLADLAKPPGDDPSAA